MTTPTYDGVPSSSRPKTASWLCRLGSIFGFGNSTPRYDQAASGPSATTDGASSTYDVPSTAESGSTTTDGASCPASRETIVIAAYPIDPAAVVAADEIAIVVPHRL